MAIVIKVKHVYPITRDSTSKNLSYRHTHIRRGKQIYKDINFTFDL